MSTGSRYGDGIPTQRPQPDETGNPLNRLVRQRVHELQAEGWSFRTLAARAGWAKPSTIEYHYRPRGPLLKVPWDQVIDGLADALDLPASKVWEAAVLSTLPEHPTPVQRVLREGQAKHRLPVEKLPVESGLTAGYIQRVLNGEAIPSGGDTIRGLAHAFGVPVKRLQQACDESNVYVVPAHIASRLTPEKWTEALRLIEAMVSEGNDGTSRGR